MTAVAAEGAPLDTSASAQPSASHHRADIQGLRDVAVLLVVLYHASAPVPGGYVGVDVFFVVSGYVITGMLTRELSGTGRLALGSFYLRRSRRLLPALATMLTIVLVASVFLAPLGAQSRTLGTGVAASVFVANLYLITLGKGGYFHTAAQTNPLLHTWSLSLEEQFYLFFPALLLVAALAVRRRPGLRRRALALTVGAVSIVSFGLCWAITNQRIPSDRLTTEFAFYTAPTRAWQFGVGALLALVAARWPKGRAVAEVVFWLGLALVAWAAIAYDDATRFPGMAAVVPTLGAALVIAAGVHARSRGSALLGSRPMTWIGDRSYSWYLWHWPVIVFARSLWPRAGGLLAVAAVVSIVPAYASYRWLEQPIRQRKADAARTARLALTCIAVPILTAAVLVHVDHTVERSGAVASFQHQVRLHADTVRGCDQGMPDITDPECTWPLPTDAAHRSTTGRMGNVLVGDSNAGQFTEVFAAASHRQGRDATVRTRNVCPVVDVVIVSHGFVDKACKQFASDMIDQLVAARPDAVMLAAATDGYLNGPEFELRDDAGHRATTPAQKSLLWEQGTNRVVERLQAAGIDVVLVDPIAKWVDWNPQDCAVVRILADEGSCSTSDSVAALQHRRALAVATDAKVAAAHPGVAVLDPFPDLCPGDPCDARRDGRLWWRDSNHVSVEGAAALADRFDRALARASG